MWSRRRKTNRIIRNIRTRRLITNVVLAKINAVTSNETLKEEEEAENDGSLYNEQEQSLIKTFDKLNENGTLEEIFREFNKFTGLSTLSTIELKALELLRKFKSGNNPNTTN